MLRSAGKSIERVREVYSEHKRRGVQRDCDGGRVIDYHNGNSHTNDTGEVRREGRRDDDDGGLNVEDVDTLRRW